MATGTTLHHGCGRRYRRPTRANFLRPMRARVTGYDKSDRVLRGTHTDSSRNDGDPVRDYRRSLVYIVRARMRHGALCLISQARADTSWGAFKRKSRRWATLWIQPHAYPPTKFYSAIFRPRVILIPNSCPTSCSGARDIQGGRCRKTLHILRSCNADFC